MRIAILDDAQEDAEIWAGEMAAVPNVGDGIVIATGDKAGSWIVTHRTFVIVTDAPFEPGIRTLLLAERKYPS